VTVIKPQFSWDKYPLVTGGVLSLSAGTVLASPQPLGPRAQCHSMVKSLELSKRESMPFCTCISGDDGVARTE